MTDPIEKLVQEIIQSERFETMKQHLEMVLAFAYGRATNQHTCPKQYAQKLEPNFDGANLALGVLALAGYVEPDLSGVYLVTKNGGQFLEENYGGSELWGVYIKDQKYR